jgi:hypothetical protein
MQEHGFCCIELGVIKFEDEMVAYYYAYEIPCEVGISLIVLER